MSIIRVMVVFDVLSITHHTTNADQVDFILNRCFDRKLDKWTKYIF